VIGCGYWGSKHVRVLHGLPEVTEIAIIDPRPERRARLVQSFGKLRAFAGLEAALNYVDAVIVATPPRTHTAIAIGAIEAGKHVLIEKPLATTSGDARWLIAAAEANSVTLMVGHTFEYNAAVWKIREAIKSKELGDVLYIDTARLNLGLYQQDVNVIWDLAPHDVSIISYLLDAQPAVVQAWGSSHAHAYLEDVATLRLEYPTSGITAQVQVSWLYPCKVRRVTVVGSAKMAIYDDLSQGEPVKIYDKGVALALDKQVAVAPDGEVQAASDEQSLHEMPMSYRYGAIVAPYIAAEEPLAVQDRHFLECICERKRPLTDGTDGLGVVQVLEAAELSLREGRPVPVGGEPALAR
jgi:predicted dehydrogenase